MKKKIGLTKVILVLLSVSLILITVVILKNSDENANNQNESNIDEEIVDNSDNNENFQVLELRDYKINVGEFYDINSFIQNVSQDLSIAYENEAMANFTEPGIYKIKIVATTTSSDTIIKSAYLIIEDKNFEENENDEDSNDLDNKVDSESNIREDSTTTPEKNNITKTTTKVKKTTTKTTTKAKKTTTKTTTKTTSKTEKTTPSEPVVIDHTHETSETYSYTYGTKITKITHSYYDVYSNGKKELTSSYDEYSYDFSSYNATTNDLKAEAQSILNANMNAINEVFNYVNQYRNEVGAKPLILESKLNLAASVRALEMGWSNNFSHTRPNGSICFSVADELGIYYYAIGENIAADYTNASAVSQGWKNSQGHYENMISTNFGKIGIGLAIVRGRYYWVQIFTN